MANNLFYTYQHPTGTVPVIPPGNNWYELYCKYGLEYPLTYYAAYNDSTIPQQLLGAYYDSFIYDVKRRTIWHEGWPFGHSYWGSSYGEVFNDFDNNSVSGHYGHAEGSYTTVSGFMNHAEGFRTTAHGFFNHVQGTATYAESVASSAEGIATSVFGYFSHTEGSWTVAYGTSSHTEGSYTISKDTASYSHVEGIKSTTVGTGSHAEGFTTTANGEYSHAEGNTTVANGAQSHSEGQGTTANGIASHAEGINSKSIGNYSHASGNTTTAQGESSTSEGVRTIASGIASHSEGTETTASGQDSHAEGYKSQATQNYAHAEGTGTTASGIASHAEGETTTASGQDSHSEGNSSKAIGKGSHAEGFTTTANGEYSHAEGNSTKAMGNASHSEGINTTVNGNYSHAEGENVTINPSHSHFGGNNITINSGNYSFGHGNGIYTNREGEAALGNYNAHDFNKSAGGDAGKPENQTVFSVGVGTGEGNRFNAFAVSKYGTSYIGINNKQYRSLVDTYNEIDVTDTHLWKGTYAEFNSLPMFPVDTIYFIEDLDDDSGGNDVATKDDVQKLIGDLDDLKNKVNLLLENVVWRSKIKGILSPVSYLWAGTYADYITNTATEAHDNTAFLCKRGDGSTFGIYNPNDDENNPATKLPEDNDNDEDDNVNEGEAGGNNSGNIEGNNSGDDSGNTGDSTGGNTGDENNKEEKPEEKPDVVLNIVVNTGINQILVRVNGVIAEGAPYTKDTTLLVKAGDTVTWICAFNAEYKDANKTGTEASEGLMVIKTTTTISPKAVPNWSNFIITVNFSWDGVTNITKVHYAVPCAENTSGGPGRPLSAGASADSFNSCMFRNANAYGHDLDKIAWIELTVQHPKLGVGVTASGLYVKYEGRTGVTTTTSIHITQNNLYDKNGQQITDLSAWMAEYYNEHLM